MRINSIEITQKTFAYDGCHKIYLINSDDEIKEATDRGYEILPIELIEEVFLDSCELRFIRTWDLLESIVGQYEKAIFEG